MSGIRESKYRSLAGKPLKKELVLTNAKPAQNADLTIKCSDKVYGFPWSTAGGGSVALFSLNHGGKAPEKDLPLLQCHKSPIADLDFSPFHGCMLATGAKEGDVKLWSIDVGSNDVLKELIEKAKKTKDPVATLNGHQKKISTLNFHPTLDNLLVSTSLDLTCRLWDLQGFQEKRAVTGHTDVVMSLSWNKEGSYFATSCKDKKLRLVDPRKKEVSLAFDAHDGAKGFLSTFTDDKHLLSVGFKENSRRMKLWDLKNIKKPLCDVEIDTGSSLLVTPFYDPYSSVVYLGSKGDIIRYYEINNSGPPYCNFINKYQSQPAYSNLCMVPRRVVNVSSCEIARFLKLTANTVEPISFQMNRQKSSELYQEDLYPDCASGKPSGVSVDKWLKGDASPLNLKSLKPEGATSVYDVPEEQGGRTRESDKIKRVRDGFVELEVQGWLFNSWELRWLSIEEQTNSLCTFETNTSATAIDQIPFAKMTHIEYDEQLSNKDTKHFNIQTLLGKTFRFKTKEAMEWVLSLNEEKDYLDGQAQEQQSNAGKSILENWLEIRLIGRFTSSWHRHYFVLTEKILFEYENSEKDREPIASFLLSKITSVLRTHDIDPAKKFTFKLTTPDKITHLAAPDDQLRKKWLDELNQLMQSAETPWLTEDSAPQKSASNQVAGDTLMESYVMRRGLGRWVQYWLLANKKELMYFNSPGDDAPQERLRIDTVEKIHEVADPESGFVLQLYDGTKILHAARNIAEQMVWIEALLLAQKSDKNILEELGINENDEDQKGVDEQNMIDVNLLKKGKQKIFIQVTGIRKLRCEVADPSSSIMSSMGVYILDMGAKIYQWNGSKSSRVFKGKGYDLANNIRIKERAGGPELIFLDQGKNDDVSEFWKNIGGKPWSFSDDPPVESEDVTRIYSISPSEDKKNLNNSVEERRKMKKTPPLVRLIFDGGLPNKELLATDTVCVVECKTEIFVWEGLNSKKKQKSLGMRIAKKLRTRRHPKHTIICRIIESAETILFKDKFRNYPDMLPIAMKTQESASNVAGTVTQEAIDAKKLHEQPALAAPYMPDDGTGKIEIWRVEETEKVPYPKELYGTFFAGDSYVMLYTYVVKNRDVNVLYFWQGRDSTIKEKGKSAALTINLGEELGSVEKQVRVVHTKEEKHFLTIFQGKYIVRRGKFPEYESNKNDLALFEIRGTSPLTCRVEEIEPDATQLSTYQSFLLCDEKKTYIWKGTQSDEVEKETSASWAQMLRKSPEAEPEVVAEGEEPEEFWTLLGGKKEYIQSTQPYKAPRLFLCSNASGAVTITPLDNWGQEDVDYYHVMILDAFYEIFVLLGYASTDLEKKLAMVAAKDYVNCSPSGHDSNTPIWVIYPYTEPLTFIRHFRGWSKANYPENKKEEPAQQAPVDEVLAVYLRETFSYDELTSVKLPPGVDPTRLEQYLSDQEFQSVFNMTREDLSKLPAWKQETVKSEVGLF